MKIVILTPWFSEKMSYVENKLPKALARLGCSVHLISSDMQIYATDSELYKIYEPFLGPSIVETGIKENDGYVFHRIPHYFSKHGIGLKGLYEKLKSIKPDVVYLFEINTEHTLQAVNYKSEFNYKIFTESRLHLSVYKPPQTFKAKLRHHFKERLKWKQVGLSFDKCYPVAPDVLYVISKYFGQDERKCKISSLAVDTDIFIPISTEDEKFRRRQLRAKFGFQETDIVCIYTGRFTDDKGAVILAKAVDLLHEQGDTKFKALFVGTGDEKYIADINNQRGCCTHPFVQSSDLVMFYQSADIGVWPKQESTSQLDAIACGLPIIISSNVEDIDRIAGNGISYNHEDILDLSIKIRSLEDLEIRKQLGVNGVNKIKQFYSWEYIAESRMKDFKGTGC